MKRKMSMEFCCEPILSWNVFDIGESVLNVARNYKIIWKILKHSNLERHRDILVELDKRSIKLSEQEAPKAEGEGCNSEDSWQREEASSENEEIGFP